MQIPSRRNSFGGVKGSIATWKFQKFLYIRAFNSNAPDISQVPFQVASEVIRGFLIFRGVRIKGLYLKVFY